MRTSPEKRAEFIAGLRELADYLDANDSVPVPDYPDLIAFADGSDVEQRQAVDKAALVLGVDAAEKKAGSGHYEAARSFGPLEYKVLAITKACMALHEAKWSYADNIADTA